MRTRSGFGVVLHRKSRLTFYPDPFDTLIVEIEMGDFNMFGFSDSFRIHTKTMVLGGDLRASADQVFHWMI